MQHPVEADLRPDVPEVFCWTKFGAEAGEDASTILARKEAERVANHGVFLWGIGNAIGPSMTSLLELTAEPKAVFTPMLSKPAPQDIAPPRIAVWHRGVGLDGSRFEVPTHSRVTSRMSHAGRAHYALVCRSDKPLALRTDGVARFAPSHVQNLRSGARVGASQVTSVVRRVSEIPDESTSSYAISFAADLVAPYLVRLTEYSLTEAFDRDSPPGGTPVSV